MTLLDLVATLTLDSSKYEAGLKDAGSKASTIGSKLGNGLKTAAKVGAAAIGAATTAVTAFAKASVDTGMEFDKSMSQVAATMGKTTDEIKDLRDFAKEMGATTAFTATQSADALNYMALAGYDAETSMAMLPNVLNLAAAGSFDLARASDMVTDTQTAFGISLERTSQMVDEMAKAASTGNTSVEQLGDAFLVVGGLAKELNGGMITLEDGTEATVDGVQELEIALTAMANAGVKGSEAGTHMRNMLLKLSSPTDAGTMALERMGVSVFDTEGKMRSLADIFGDLSTEMDKMTQEDKINTISNLFNTRDMASAEALLNAVNQDWDSIGESILNASGAAGQMAKTQLDNLAGDVTLFKSALDGVKIAISDGLSPSLREFVQLGTKGLESLTTVFSKFDPTPYLDANGQMTKEGAEAAKEFGEQRAKAMDELFATFSDGLSLIIKKIPEMVNIGMRLLQALGKGIMDNLDILIQATVDIVNGLLAGLVEALPDLLEGATTLLVGLIEGVMEVLPTLIPMIIDSVLELVPQLMTMVTDIVVELAKMLADNADKLITGAVELISTLAEGLVDSLPELIPAIVKIITELAISLTDPENLMKLIDAAITIIMAIDEGLIEAIPVLVEAAPEIIMNLITALLELVPELLVAGAELIAKLAMGIAGAGAKIAQAAVDTFNTFKDNIKKRVDDAKTWGKDLIENFIGGIKEKWEKLKETVSNVAQTVKDFLGFSEPKKGPLSNFHTYAPDMIDLFVEGVNDNKPKLINAVSSAFDFEDVISGNGEIELTSSLGSQGFESRTGASYYTINVNQPVSTPADMLREIKTQSQYGLLIGESLA